MCVGECVCVSCGRVYVSNRSNVTKRLIQMMSARKNRYASGNGNGNGNDSSSDAGSSVTHTRHPHQPTACPRCPHPLPRQVHPFPPTCAHTYEQAKQAEARRAERKGREVRHKQQTACETHEDARCCSARVTVTTTPNDAGSDAALTLLLLRHIKYIFALSQQQQQQQQLHEYEQQQQQQKQSTSSHVTYTEKIYRMYLCVCVRVYEIHLHTHA